MLYEPVHVVAGERSAPAIRTRLAAKRLRANRVESVAELASVLGQGLVPAVVVTEETTLSDPATRRVLEEWRRRTQPLAVVLLGERGERGLPPPDGLWQVVPPAEVAAACVTARWAALKAMVAEESRQERHLPFPVRLALAQSLLPKGPEDRSAPAGGEGVSLVARTAGISREHLSRQSSRAGVDLSGVIARRRLADVVVWREAYDTTWFRAALVHGYESSDGVGKAARRLWGRGLREMERLGADLHVEETVAWLRAMLRPRDVDVGGGGADGPR